MAGQKSVVVIPSFTLLLIGSEEKERLVEVLIKWLRRKKVVAFVAVNSAMFEDYNRKLAENADNVLEFLKRGEKVYIKPVKFRGIAPGEDNPPVAITFRNLPWESPQVVVVFDRPVDGEMVARLEAIRGVSRVVVKPPEKDRTRLVCTFCDIIYCSRRKFGGDGGEN